MLTTGWTVPQLLKQMKMVAPYRAPKMMNKSVELVLQPKNQNSKKSIHQQVS